MIVLRCDRCGADLKGRVDSDAHSEGDSWPGASVLVIKNVRVSGDFCPYCSQEITELISTPPPKCGQGQGGLQQSNAGERGGILI